MVVDSHLLNLNGTNGILWRRIEGGLANRQSKAVQKLSEGQHVPIKAMCPECQTQYSVPDTAAGKKVKCRSCEFVFPIPGPKKIARPAAKDPWEEDDSADKIPLLTPARKAKPRPGDALPPKIVKAKKATYIADDEDDEPKPKKTRKKRQQSEMDPRLMFLAIAIGVVVLAGIAGFFEPQITLWVGIIALCGGGLWQLAMAWEEDEFTGWLHMKVPGYSFYFAITRIGETWPAVLVQFLGLMLCFSYAVLEHRQNGGGVLARAINNMQDGDVEEIEDPEDIPIIKAARPFADALSTGKQEAAFAELSPLALANAYRDQFIPPADNERERTSVAPLTLESFRELMSESEKVLGRPAAVEHIYVESRDPELLSGGGNAIERALVMGGIPEGIPVPVRKAVLHVRLAVKHPDFPESEDDEGPYLNMRLLVTEEEGRLRVGYFELKPPSILD